MMAATYFAADVILDWSGSLEPQAFFRSTRAAAGASDNRDTISLNMDGRFLGAFSRLPDAAADEVLATIKRNPITTIYVGTFPLPNNHRGVASDNAYISRLVLLFCCLKSLRSIKNVFLDATPKEGIEHAMTLQYLRNAQNLTLMGQFGYQVTSELFAASFKMLTKLHHVKIHLAGDCLGFLQPLLCTRSPYLLHLSLIKVASAGPVTLNDAQSLFSILACGKILIVEIENFELSGENVCRIFCDGVAQAKMHVFDLKNCVVHDPIHFAHALSVSQVTVTSLYEVMFALERTKLNTCIKSSKDFEKNPRRKCAASPNSHVLAHLVGNLSRSVLFDSLGVTTELYAADLDEALAFCVTDRLDIDKFEVSCSAILPTQPGYKSPALLDAMRTNYGLRNCTFRFPPTLNDSLKDPWDPDFKEEVAMYCRLNNSGRGYLAIDAENKYKGSTVLETVTDDLNCLLCRVRENPSLCLRHVEPKVSLRSMIGELTVKLASVSLEDDRVGHSLIIARSSMKDGHSKCISVTSGSRPPMPAEPVASRVLTIACQSHPTLRDTGYQKQLQTLGQSPLLHAHARPDRKRKLSDGFDNASTGVNGLAFIEPLAHDRRGRKRQKTE